MSADDTGYIPLTPAAEDADDAEFRGSGQSRSALPPPETLLLPTGSFPGEDKTLNLPGGIFTVHGDGRSYSYAYGPKGLAGLRHNRYALMCAFFASLGGLEFGYDQGVIANVLVMEDFIYRFPLTPFQKGILTAVLELGALIGALSAGVYADRHSRRHSIIVACVIFCVGSSFQAFAQHLSHIFIGRAIGGLGVGALSMLSPLYMAEISAPEVRGSLLALEQFSIVLGVVLGFWIGFITRGYESSASWRIPLGIQLVPGIILAIGCYFLPPSPRLLVLHEKYDEALESLGKLRMRRRDEVKGDVLLQIELLEMRVETKLIEESLGVESAVTHHTAKSGIQLEWLAWKKLFDERYIDRTWIGVLIMVFQQWSGINALLYYGPSLVRSIGISGDDTVSLIVSGGIGIVQFLAVVPAIVWIDRVGRKGLLKWGSIAMTASHLWIALLIIMFSSSWSRHPWGAWLAVGGIYTFTAAYGVSFGPIGWVLPSEVFPLSMRSKGVALSTASNWINNFFIGLLTPVLVDLSPTLTFLIFASACFLAFLWAKFYVPETANVSLEEVDKLFRSSVGSEERALKARIEQELGLRDLIKELTDESVQ